MKKTTTLIIYLLLLQTAFAAPEVIWEEPAPRTTIMSPSPELDTPPLWSMEYRLMLLTDLQTQSQPVKVYPNPVNRKDELNISLKGSGQKFLSFYDITGKMVKQVVTEKNVISLSVADLGEGVYILNVKSPSLQTTKKVIIR
ncbi:T9SS type A sorting domain-containing protein [Robertkochia sediminum]|uniref:T9SS type A sorting domain-containing protein n=1 Tax=Robertkochia sediminum TaxID=2785326 RepID=UPI0019328B1B|nr:T9SS type A sorting domain-containing protein [Robertkochia sediminum]MBL7472647.1 T9SS type A sorting domain-containing protein [Robertkochia sediminum]